MSKVVDYNVFPEEERKPMALLHLREWMGEEMYLRAARELQKCEDTPNNRAFLRGAFAHLTGVDGLPVEAFLDKYLGKEVKKNA